MDVEVTATREGGVGARENEGEGRDRVGRMGEEAM